MSNIAKDVLIKSRDKFNAKLVRQVDALSAELASTREDILNLKNIVTRESVRMIPISDKLIVVKMFSDLKICLDPSDIAVVPHLALDGIWEETTTIAWLACLRPDQVVLDIGANFGYYGALAAQRSAHPNQKVIFFEANPDLVPYMDRTLSINGLHRQCTIENLGVAESKGKAVLTVLEDYIGCSSLNTIEHLDSYLHDKMDVRASKEVTVDTISIDGYCKTNHIDQVDLIKLDIEGYEDRAYKGMKETIKSSPDLVMFIEFTRQSYADPQGFFKQIVKDFKYIYNINDSDGTLTIPKSVAYEALLGSQDSFIMLVLSKKALV